MTATLETVKAFLDQEKWAYEEHPEGNALRMRFKGEAGEWVVVARDVDDGQKLLVYSLPSNTIPADRRPAVAEALCRINYGLILGNWEMDVRDGEIRYKTSVDVRGVEPSVEMVQHLVFMNVVMTDRYLPALLGVAYGQQSPEAAVAAVESAEGGEG
jgi:hypothetical protein